MNVDRISDAADVVAWLAEQAGTPGEESSKRAEMALLLQMARLYLVEYTVHVSRGSEPYDALVATARGDLQLTPQQKDLWRALGPASKE